MAVQRGAMAPLQLCIRCARQSAVSSGHVVAAVRAFSSTVRSLEEVQIEKPADAQPPLDPNTVSKRSEEIQLLKSGISPIGSRRRRAAIRSSANIPFEQLPYQCFQEARQFLKEDRDEKIKDIEKMRGRISRLEAQDASAVGGQEVKEQRLRSMRNELEKLKILADINDPLVKKRFEDKQGDMNKPIYRFLADRSWRSYKRKIIVQRIEQMHIVPDVLPTLDPTAAVDMSFGRTKVTPGEFVQAQISSRPPSLNVQVFDKGERMVSVVVVDSDVPDVEKDGFDYRCHYIACNIPISPTSTRIPLGKLSEENQVVLPWLPPYSQKGAPYHRLSVFVLQQKPGQTLDLAAIRAKYQRDGFKLLSFVHKFELKPIGVNLFRSVWDDTTAGVMQRHGIPGWDVEFKRKRVEPLPYKKKDSKRFR